MKLYQLPISPFSARISIIASEKQVPLELAAPHATSPTTPGLASVHPLSFAPVLIDGTLAIADTNTIAEYLDERYTTPSMMPSTPEQRAKSRVLTRFHDTVLAPAIADAYTNISAGASGPTDAKLIHEHLVSLERRIDPSPWFFGETFGIADSAFCLSVWYAIQLTHAASLPLDEARLPKLLDWFARASQRPSVARAVRDAQNNLDPTLVSRLCDPIWFGAHSTNQRADRSEWSTTAA